MNLQPSVKQMLDVAEGCYLETVDEAFDNYINHYDVFFIINDYPKQYSQLIKDLDEIGLIEHLPNGSRSISQITIAEANTLIKNAK